MIFCQYSLNIDKKAWIERRNQNSVIPDLIRDPDPYFAYPYFASRILHFSCTIAQCVGKRRLMSVKKFSVSFFSRRSATGTLIGFQNLWFCPDNIYPEGEVKNEVFAPATRVRLGRKLGASFSFLQVSFAPVRLWRRKRNVETKAFVTSSLHLSAFGGKKKS